MLKLKKEDLLFSSFWGANIYEISDLIGTFQGGRAYRVKLCVDQSNYIAICHDFYGADGINDRNLHLIKLICKRTYGGQFYGSDCIAPIDYIIEGKFSQKTRNTLILIYPEYETYDLQPVSDIIDGKNAIKYIKGLLDIVEKLHDRGFAAGGFNEYNLLLERKSGRLKLVLGANLVSGIHDCREKALYEKVGKFSEEARGFRREKLLGLPEKSCWEQLNLVDYARCSDIYSVVTLGFRALIGFHPLQSSLCDGMESDELRQEIYQQNPMFIFGAEQKNNLFGFWKNEQEAEERWVELPEELRKLYQEIYAFPNFDSDVARQYVQNMACFSAGSWMKALKFSEAGNQDSI